MIYTSATAVIDIVIIGFVCVALFASTATPSVSVTTHEDTGIEEK